MGSFFLALFLKLVEEGVFDLQLLLAFDPALDKIVNICLLLGSFLPKEVQLIQFLGVYFIFKNYFSLIVDGKIIIVHILSE